MLLFSSDGLWFFSITALSFWNVIDFYDLFRSRVFYSELAAELLKLCMPPECDRIETDLWPDEPASPQLFSSVWRMFEDLQPP